MLVCTPQQQSFAKLLTWVLNTAINNRTLDTRRFVLRICVSEILANTWIGNSSFEGVVSILSAYKRQGTNLSTLINLVTSYLCIRSIILDTSTEALAMLYIITLHVQRLLEDYDVLSSRRTI
jgi:hypothetical protein